MKISLITGSTGLVGSEVAMFFKDKFDLIIGIDNNKKRIQELIKNYDRTGEVGSLDLKKNQNKIKFTSQYSSIKYSNIIIVTLPTPIFKNKKPNLNILKDACKKIGQNIKKNDLVIFESTVYPGATRSIFIPIIEKYSKFKLNCNFFCGYSPERINPGDKKHNIRNE